MREGEKGGSEKLREEKREGERNYLDIQRPREKRRRVLVARALNYIGIVEKFPRNV